MVDNKKETKQKLDVFREMSTRKVEFCAEICEGMDCPVEPATYESDWWCK